VSPRSPSGIEGRKRKIKKKWALMLLPVMRPDLYIRDRRCRAALGHRVKSSIGNNKYGPEITQHEAPFLADKTWHSSVADRLVKSWDGGRDPT